MPVLSINAPASIPGIDFSDHLNYWAGLPRSDDHRHRLLPEPHYHGPTTVDTLDYERMAMVVQGVYAAMTTLK